MLLRIRNWLLMKLADRSTVAINANIAGGELVITKSQSLVAGTVIVGDDVYLKNAIRLAILGVFSQIAEEQVGQNG